MSRIALALLTAVFSLAAAQDEMIENPEYKGWAGQKVGAWVKFKTEMDAGGMKIDNTTTTKLKEISAEKAVLDQAIEMDMGGQKRTMNMSRTAPAKIKKGTDSEGAKVEIVAEGDEEIEIKGTKYKCHWVEMKTDSKQAGPATMKVWRTDKIIGGFAKMTIKGEKMNMTMTALDWKAGE
jgi:hypothetical protein